MICGAAGWSPFNEGGDEAVAALRDGLDEAGLRGIVAENFAQLEHVGAENLRLDEGLGPQSIEQLVVGDEATWIFNEIAEHGELPGRQRDGNVVAPQTFVRCIEPEGGELFHRAGSCPANKPRGDESTSTSRV